MHRVEKWETNVHVFTKILFFFRPNNVKFNAFFPSNNLSLLSKLCEFIVNENSNCLVTNSYIHTSYILCTRWLYMFIFSLRIKCKFVYVLVIFSMNLRDKINCLTVQTIYNLLLIYITNAFIPQIVWNEFTARCFEIIHCTCTFIKYHRHSKNIYLPFVLLSVTSLRSFEPFSWIIISETKKNIWNKFHGAEMLVDVNKLFVCCS